MSHKGALCQLGGRRGGGLRFGVHDHDLRQAWAVMYRYPALLDGGKAFGLASQQCALEYSMKRLFSMCRHDFRPHALQQLELILQQFPEIARIRVIDLLDHFPVSRLDQLK